jgi:hypothetical protein
MRKRELAAVYDNGISVERDQPPDPASVSIPRPPHPAADVQNTALDRCPHAGSEHDREFLSSGHALRRSASREASVNTALAILLAARVLQRTRL